MADVNESIGARLRALRVTAELSARELDRLAGRTEGHSNLIETRPEAHVTAGVAADYARVLGATLDWLIAGKGSAPSSRTIKQAVAAARVPRAG